MGAKVKELTEAEFKDAVASGICLVDFWAPWCGPCQMMGPILDALAESVGDAATIAKVNVDENNAMAVKFGVQSIPTLIVFRDGEEVNRFVRVQTEETLHAAIKAAAE